MQQRFDLGWGFIPAFLERCLASVFGDCDVGCVEFAVADDLHSWDGGDLFTHQLEDRTAEVASDAFVRPRVLQTHTEKSVVESLVTGREAVDVSHADLAELQRRNGSSEMSHFWGI